MALRGATCHHMRLCCPVPPEMTAGLSLPAVSGTPIELDRVGSEDLLRHRRSMAGQRGGLSLLAAVGCGTPEGTGKRPGCLSPPAGLKFLDGSAGLAAVSRVQVAGWVQICATGGYCGPLGGRPVQ